MKIEAATRGGHSWDILSECGPPIDPIDTENGAPQIYAVGCGDDRASAARLRRADLNTTTCRAPSENDMLRNAVEGGVACALSAEAHPPSPSRMGMFQMYVLAKQELRVDRGMNRGESWGPNGQLIYSKRQEVFLKRLT